ncbi:MAG: hypothetical protein KGH71_02445 [Candidatus Micrarchaeota archaeon]|nr:hypothetical protein [Candidatus Micrarchaeota archaeon]
MIKPSEARIHAHICADGYTYTSVARRNEADIKNNFRKSIFRKYYHVRYSNTQILLKRLFQKDVKEAYKRKAFLVANNEVEVQGKWIFDRLRGMGALDSHSWRIDSQIFEGYKKLQLEWLKAFFDDEGTVDTSRKRVRIKSVNKNGLEQIGIMLSQVGIKSVITGPNSDKTWYLTVNKGDLIKFSKFIGFRHVKRKIKLKALVRPLLSFNSALSNGSHGKRES